MVILYPTETVYGLGVNPFDENALQALYELKGRDVGKPMSWLVRDIDDIQRYADVSDSALKIARKFLPGPLTLILPVRVDSIPKHLQYLTYISFRISSDAVAQKVIAKHMEKFNAPLTCTSANISGEKTLLNVKEILNQFGPKQSLITEVYDDGDRIGLPSTVIKVEGDTLTCVREGAVLFELIEEAIV